MVWVAAIMFSHADHAEINYVAWLASYHVVPQCLRAQSSVLWRRSERDWVSSFRMLGATEREEMIARVWSGGARVRLRNALADDLVSTSENGTEQFPLPNAYRRRIEVAFWAVIAIAAIALAAPLALSMPRWMGWTSLSVGSLLVFASARLRRYRIAADSIIEITPYAIAMVSPGGERVAIHWSSGIGLVNRPRARVVDIVDLSSGKRLPVHYARAGFKRIVDVAIERS